MSLPSLRSSSLFVAASLLPAAMACSGSGESDPSSSSTPNGETPSGPGATGGTTSGSDPNVAGGTNGTGAQPSATGGAANGTGGVDAGTGGTGNPPPPIDIDPCSHENDGDRYLHDTVNIMVYRFEFPDAALEYSEQELLADLEKVVTYFSEQSYGRFQVTYEIHPEIFMATSPNTSFDDDWHAYREWYQNTISSVGVDPENPGDTNRIMVTSPQIGNFNSSGGPPLMTVFHPGAGTIAHELGHTLGLRHSKAIEAGPQIIGAGNYDDEALNYGNVYGLMGMGAHSHEEINLLYKHYFGWITCDEVPEISETGTYRIHAFDRGEVGGDHIGLAIKSGNELYRYWIEYRTRGGHTTGNGVLLNLQGYFENEQQEEYWKTTSYLLDMTPESMTTDGWWSDDQTDSELLVGETYVDHWGGFEIKPIATGGNTADSSAWIDVEVTFNP